MSAIFIYAIITRGGNNIPSGINPSKNNNVTVEGLRQLMAGKELIDTIANENNNNGELINPINTWYAIDFQLHRSKKYNSVISPSIPSTSSLLVNENARIEFSTRNLIINSILLLIHLKSSLTSNQGL